MAAVVDSVVYCIQQCVFVCVNVVTVRIKPSLGALQRRKNSKSEITMEVGGWVQVSLGVCFLENRPKIGLKQFLE